MQRLVLQVTDIDSLRSRLNSTGIDPFRKIEPCGITLPALFELACWSSVLPSSNAAIGQLIDKWSRALPQITIVRQFFSAGEGSISNIVLLTLPVRNSGQSAQDPIGRAMVRHCFNPASREASAIADSDRSWPWHSPKLFRKWLTTSCSTAGVTKIIQHWVW